MTAERQKIHLYELGPVWAAPLPTGAPFPLKLETWLRIAGLPYEAHVENDTRKGPKRKSPWIVDGEVSMGDTELIIAYLVRRYGVDPDARLSRAQRASSLAFRRLLEEHYHQVIEHALFLQSGGEERLTQFVATVPALMRPIVKRIMRAALRKQLWERGVGRHDVAQIVEMGCADLDAVAEALGDGPFFFGEEPTGIDATVFAFVVLTLHPHIDQPLHDHARSLPVLGAYCARMIDRFFPEARSVAVALRAAGPAASSLPVDSPAGGVA